MEEAEDRPPAMILIDNYFAVYRNRRRALVSGDAPHGPHAGLTFQFVRKRLLGSYLAFTLASRS
jgi:hypothetical protein